MKKNTNKTHPAFLVLAVIIRILAGGWKWPGRGSASNIGRQIGTGLLLFLEKFIYTLIM